MNYINKFLAFLLLFVANTAFADLRGLPTISVLAVSSSHKAVTEIIREYSKKHNITISATFDSAPELTDLIIDGESADVFICDSYDYIEQLKQQGVIHFETPTVIARNKLVLAASKNHVINRRLKDEKLNAQELMSQIVGQMLPITQIVIADYSMLPLGDYTSQVLSKMGLWYKSKRYFILAIDSDNALYLVAKGNNVGVLYGSDVYNNDELNVLAEFNSSDHEEIKYWATVVVDRNMENGLNFIKYLSSPEAQKIFKENGFMLP